jgi:VanZ family protein
VSQIVDSITIQRSTPAHRRAHVNSVTSTTQPGFDAQVAATQRVLRWVLGCYALFVVCASLYPFTFAPPDPNQPGLDGLTHWRSPTRRDLIINLLAYAPLGWLLAHLLRPRVGRLAALGLACASAAALSLTLEVLQHWVTVRVPSFADWTLNFVSGATGALLAIAQPTRESSAVATRLRRLQVSPALALLLVLWVAAHAAPFMPRLRSRLIDAAWQAALDASLDLARFATHVASGLVLAAVLRTLVRRDAFWPLFLAFLGGSLLARLLFIGQALTLDQVFAASFVIAATAWLRRSGHRSAQTPLFLMIVAALLIAGTAPWELSAGFNPVDWRPFGALLSGRESADITGLLLHVFLWIGAVWVGAGSRYGLRGTALMLAGLSVAIEVAQCFLAGRVADPTHLLLVLYGTMLVQAAQAIDDPARAA